MEVRKRKKTQREKRRRKREKEKEKRRKNSKRGKEKEERKWFCQDKERETNKKIEKKGTVSLFLFLKNRKTFSSFLFLFFFSSFSLFPFSSSFLFFFFCFLFHLDRFYCKFGNIAVPGNYLPQDANGVIPGKLKNKTEKIKIRKEMKWGEKEPKKEQWIVFVFIFSFFRWYLSDSSSSTSCRWSFYCKWWKVILFL